MKGGIFTKGRLTNKGCSIVEVLVVVAVTGALFIGVVLMVAGKQDKARFEQSVNSVKAQIETVINEVQSGYPGSSQGCNYTGSSPTASASAGSSNTCIFLGKALQFTTGSQKNSYGVHSIVGRRDSTNVGSAQAYTFAPWFETKSLWHGLEMVSMNGGGTPVSMVSFTLDYEVDSDGAAYGSQALRVQPVRGTAWTNSFADWSGRSIASELAASPVNPAAGVTICLASGGTNQSALMTIGAGQSSRVTTEIKQNRTCA